VILDRVRFENWLKTADLPQNIRDTIEDFLSWEDCDQEIGELKKQIEQLKKDLEIASKMVITIPITRPNEGEMKIITAKFDGTCKECGGIMPAGKQIRWSKAIGAKHLVGECR
jgi:hypothetical protein